MPGAISNGREGLPEGRGQGCPSNLFRRAIFPEGKQAVIVNSVTAFLMALFLKVNNPNIAPAITACANRERLLLVS